MPPGPQSCLPYTENLGRTSYSLTGAGGQVVYFLSRIRMLLEGLHKSVVN